MSNLGDVSVIRTTAATVGTMATIGVMDTGAAYTGTVQFGSDLMAGDETDWHERALCAQTDPESFFPEKGGSTREAKKICTGCEVRSECLSYALANDERFGIWGGLSERERRRLKRSAG